jgi:hypothetical protein
MASIEESITSILKASAPLTAKVKNRVRPLAFTELDVMPCVAYQVQSTESFDTFTGSADWLRIQMEVAVFGESYADTKAIGAIVRGLLHNYSGTVEGIQIGFAKHKEDTDLMEPPEVGDEKPIHRLSSNYLIMYRPA